MPVHECPTTDQGIPRTDEEDARYVLSPFLREDLVVWDDGSNPRMWDFCMVGKDHEHLGSLEVTRYTDPTRRAFSEDLYSQGSSWPAPSFLNNRWVVELKDSVRLKRFDRDGLFQLLSRAEGEGLLRLLPRYGTPFHEEVEAIGIRIAAQVGDEPGKIYVLPAFVARWGEGFVTPGVLAEVDANAEKLRGAPGPRHLFVWIDYAATPATWEMTSDGPTTDPINLPSFVDVVWAVCGEVNLDGAAVWRASGGEPWQVLREFL